MFIKLNGFILFKYCMVYRVIEIILKKKSHAVADGYTKIQIIRVSCDNTTCICIQTHTVYTQNNRFSLRLTKVVLACKHTPPTSDYT